MDLQWKKKLIVMLSGYLQSGKDTVGEHLCRSYNFKRYAFADILKDEVSSMYKVTRGLLDTQAGKSMLVHDPLTGGKRTARQILIEHGQMRRAENVDYWVSKVQQKILADNCDRAVVTDWRFPNEHVVFLDSMTKHGYNLQTWRLNRWSEAPLRDLSEVALDSFQFDHVIQNAGSVSEFLRSVDSIICKHGKLPTLITDVDDVLLQWLPAFKSHLESRSFSFNKSYPSQWSLDGWVSSPSGELLDVVEVQKLILEFNHSPDFGKLMPYEEASPVLRKLKELGFIIAAVSSCTDDAEAYARRLNNLNTHFGNGLFNKVICLGLGQSKADVLSGFSPSLWLDDNVSNVEVGAHYGHRSYLMTRPWNRNINAVCRIDDWQDVLKLSRDLLGNEDHVS